MVGPGRASLLVRGARDGGPETDPPPLGGGRSELGKHPEAPSEAVWC